MRGRRRGYTLRAPIVSACLLTLLAAALLFPVYARPRGCDTVNCMGNVKQVPLALLQYAGDFDGRLPQREDPAGRSWRSAIHPYCKHDGVFTCPGARVGRVLRPGWTIIPRDRAYGADGLPCDYAVNNAGDQLGIGRTPPRLDELAEPASCVLIVELDGRPWSDFASPWWGGTRNWESGWAGHYGSWNVAYADGHAKPSSPLGTSHLRWCWDGSDGGIDWRASMRMVPAVDPRQGSPR